MSKKAIRKAFEDRLRIWAETQDPAHSVAWQNAVFSPGADPYLRAFILPADTTSNDLKGDHRCYKGIFQINIVQAAGIGPGKAETIAEQIAALFPVNMRLPAGAGEVMIYTPMSESAPIVEATTYTIPVWCRYRMDTI